MRLQLILGIFGIMLLSALSFADGVYLNPAAMPYGFSWNAIGCSSGYYTYQCIDEGYPPDTSDWLYTYNRNTTAAFVFQNLSVQATSVNYIHIYYYAKYYSSTYYKFHPYLMGESSDGIEVGPTFSTNSNYQYYSVVYYENPWTGQPWTPQEVNDLSVGMLSATSNGGAKIAQMDMYVSYEVD